jgi:hypothetical protein
MRCGWRVGEIEGHPDRCENLVIWFISHSTLEGGTYCSWCGLYLYLVAVSCVAMLLVYELVHKIDQNISRPSCAVSIDGL